MAETQPRPFKIDVRQETVNWITQRVQDARVVPDAVKLPTDREWEDGVPSTVISELVEYWKTSYDWRKVEEKLNSTYKMFTLDISEGDEVLQVHFVHHVSERPGAIPLLFVHGWPGNFTEVSLLLRMLCSNENMEIFWLDRLKVSSVLYPLQTQPTKHSILWPRRFQDLYSPPRPRFVGINLSPIFFKEFARHQNLGFRT